MSKYRNRGGEVWEKHDGAERELYAGDVIERLDAYETELTDLKAQFAEYVRSEEKWRDSSYESDRWKAKELREQAILTLGL